jgi:autotransporter translocation and assembly factor TamB
MNKKPFKMFFYIALFLFISFFFFGAVFYLTLLLPPVQLKVVNIVGNELSKIITGDIKIGKVKSNLLSYLDLVDVSIKDRENPEVYVYCSHIRVRYYLPALLKKKLHITSVQSDQLDAHLRVTKKGRYQIPFLPRPEFKFKQNSFIDWKIQVGTLRIKEINATYNDSLLKMYCSTNRASCIAKFPRLDSILVSFETSEGFFHSQWWYGHLDTVSTQVILQPKSVYAQHAFVHGSSSTVTGYGRVPFNFTDPWDIHVVGSSNILPVHALENAAPAFGSEGHAQVKASWTGTFKKPLYSLEIRGAGVSYEGILLDTFTVKSNTDLNECIHLNVFGSSDLGELKVDGKVKILNLNSFHPTVDKYTFNTRLENIRMPALANQIKEIRKIPGDTASLIVSIDGIGYQDVPKIARIDLAIRKKNMLESLSLSGNLRNHAWNVSGDWGNNQIEGEGTFHKDGELKGTISGDIRNPLLISKYFLNESIQGNLSFRALLSGKVNNQIIDADIKSSGLKWRGTKIDSLNTSIVVNKNLFIKHGFCAAKVKLDSIAKFFGKSDLKGDLKLKVNASGPLAHPVLEMGIDGKKISYKMSLADSCFGKIMIHGLDSISLDNLTLLKSKSLIVLNGAVNIADYLNVGRGVQAELAVDTKLLRNSSYANAGNLKLSGYFGKDSMDADIISSEFDLAVLHGWVEKLKNVHGIVTVSSSISGTKHNPMGSFSIIAKSPDYNGISAKKFRTRCVLQDSVLHFDSTYLALDSVSKIFVSGFVPLSPGRGWKLENGLSRAGKVYIQSDNLDIAYFSRLLKSDWKFQGSSLVSVDLTLGNDGWSLGGSATLQKGTFNNSLENIYGSDISLISKIAGNLKKPTVAYSISTGKVVLNTVKIDSTKIRGALRNDSISISDGWVSLFNGGVLALKGVAPFRITDGTFSQSGVNLQFKISDVACTELNTFTGNELIQSGILSGAGTLGFKQGRPVIDGKITLDKGKFSVDGVEPVIGPLNAEFVLSNDTVKVARCKGSWGNGAVDVIGFLVWSLDSLKDIALSGKIKNVSIDLPDIATSRIQSFQFAFSHRKNDFLLSGSADIGATRIIRDIRLTDLIDQMNYSIPLEKEENQFLKSVNLNIKLNLVENPILDINLGYLEFVGGLSVTGNALNPTFVGDLSIVDGYVLYLDRQFNIANGHLSNYDPYVFNPTINVSAKNGVTYSETDSNSVTDTMTLNILGDLKKIKFSLSSSSNSLTEADIISILTFGQRLGNVGGDIKQRIKVFAGQSLLGLGTRKLEQFLDIDKIDVSGDIFDYSAEKSAKLTVSKRISPKLMLSYETAIANLSRRKISASYSLTKYFYLRGETENKGESGIDFIFKYSK